MEQIPNQEIHRDQVAESLRQNPEDTRWADVV